MPVVEMILGGTVIGLLGTAIGAGFSRRGVMLEKTHELLCRNVCLTITQAVGKQINEVKDELIEEIRNGKSSSTHER